MELILAEIEMIWFLRKTLTHPGKWLRTCTEKSKDMVCDVVSQCPSGIGETCLLPTKPESRKMPLTFGRSCTATPSLGKVWKDVLLEYFRKTSGQSVWSTCMQVGKCWKKTCLNPELAAYRKKLLSRMWAWIVFLQGFCMIDSTPAPIGMYATLCNKWMYKLDKC